jgi:hypothetical protein
VGTGTWETDELSPLPQQRNSKEGKDKTPRHEGVWRNEV